MTYAACTAAARGDAPRGASSVTKYGVYRRSMPLTASKIAACVIAAIRPEFCGEVLVAVSALTST